MIAWQLAVIAVTATAPTGSSPTVAESGWAVHDQFQMPAMAANHVVGGAGLGLAIEKGAFAIDAEAQILFVAICEASCGPAYAGGVGVSAMLRRWTSVTTHVSLLARYFAQPSLHQYVPALSPRAGLRWLSGTTGVSLDAGLTLAMADNFDPGGFARNKVLSWAMPELIMGIWF